MKKLSSAHPKTSRHSRYKHPSLGQIQNTHEVLKEPQISPMVLHFDPNNFSKAFLRLDIKQVMSCSSCSIEWAAHNQKVFDNVTRPSQTISVQGLDLCPLYWSAEQVFYHPDPADPAVLKKVC